jgi:photosystem II stability/assembly factor-like uncharacterized protein
MPASHEREGFSLTRPHHAPGVLGAAFVTILLAALLAGCGFIGNSPHPTPTAAPTPTLAPARRLVWQAHQPPVALGTSGQGFNGGLAVAQSGGDTAYACSPEGAPQGHVQVWATHDRAAHWARVSDVVASSSISLCSLVVDGLKSSSVIALACAPDTQPGSYCAASSSFLTLDGGATWRPVRGPLPQFRQLAGHGGVTYSLTATPSHSFCVDCTEALATSRDGMRAWTRIDKAITAAGRFVTRFWLDPASGALLAETSNQNLLQNELWLTTDGGAHWSRTPNPVADSYFVRPLLPNVPWSACGNHSSSPPTSYPSLLVCTGDSGRTWSQAGGPYVNPAFAFTVALAADGSILAAWSSPGAPGGYELRRLPPTGHGWGSSWEPLGPLPAAGPLTFATGTGTLWLIAASGGGNQQVTLYTATYL